MKIMPTKIRQGDPRWSSVRLGPSNVTVGGYGCTTCSMCMALESLRGYFCNPGDAARHWTYNQRGEIIWGATEWKGMDFVKRGYGKNTEEIASYANGQSTAVILEVNNGAHWVYCDHVKDGEFAIIDPIDGEYYETLPSKYTVTGYSLFEGNGDLPSPWAEDSWAWGIENGITNGDNPRGTATREEVVEMLYNLNK